MRHRQKKSKSSGLSGPISWERARGIFGNPKPPQRIWERQFDYDDEALHRIARTPYDEIDFSDLWYYHHDLAYVELQPDLFAYLFPVCLMDWHQTLMQNEACSHGDSEFHYGVWQGNVFEKMMTPEQREAVFEFFRDSFLIRLDAERGFVYSGSKTPAYGWMGRFSSLGIILPGIEKLWNTWWSLNTPGRAVAALQYCSGLMYFEWDENPLFGNWTQAEGGGGPYLSNNDSHIYQAGWLPENLAFLTKALTPDFVKDRVKCAVDCLKNEPEWDTAKRLKDDLPKVEDAIQITIDELLAGLAK